MSNIYQQCLALHRGEISINHYDQVICALRKFFDRYTPSFVLLKDSKLTKAEENKLREYGFYIYNRIQGSNCQIDTIFSLFPLENIDMRFEAFDTQELNSNRLLF